MKRVDAMKHQNQSKFISPIRFLFSTAVVFFVLAMSNVMSQETKTLSANTCPSISANIVDTDTENERAIFRATIEGNNSDVTFNWSISSGEIIEGQGTNQIVVKASGIGFISLTVVVEVKGNFPSNCPLTASVSTEFKCGLRPSNKKVSDRKFTNEEDLEIEMDSLAIELQNDPAAKAYVYFYPQHKGSSKQVKKFIDFAKAQLKKRGIVEDRIVMREGNPRKNNFLVVWVAFPFNDEPKPDDEINK